MKILAIDLGNTRASFGLFETHQLIQRYDMPSARLSEFPKDISSKRFDICVISDVSQERNAHEDWLRNTIDCPILKLSAEKAAIKIAYDPPESLGHDRIANALAANIYAPKGAIVIDLGTASHFDVVAADGTFLGGPIVAGLDLIHRCLSASLPHLPKTQVKAPIKAVPQSTSSALESGAFLMQAGGIDRIVAVMRQSLNFEPTILLTGGNAMRLKEHIVYDRHCPNLTLEGICRYGIRLAKENESI